MKRVSESQGGTGGYWLIIYLLLIIINGTREKKTADSDIFQSSSDQTEFTATRLTYVRTTEYTHC